MSPCPSREQLLRLLEDQLSQTDEALIAAHLEGCGNCQELLEQWLARPPLSVAGLSRTGAPEQSDELDPALGARSSRAVPLSRALPRDGSYPGVPGYDLVGELGRGGMGIVYRAWQRGLHRLVALKMLLDGPHASAERVARLRREAEVIARLRHPNIVQIYEIGEQDGRPFFSMELLEGGSLEKRLRGIPQSPRVAADLVRTLAGAMQAAHEGGIVHRDLKPANVLLTFPPGQHREEFFSEGGRVEQGLANLVPRISDFGLAKLLSGAAEGDAPPADGRVQPAGELTRTGVILGSPSYMAPEQVQGTPEEVGPAADVYALGAILYELLTGRPPFRGETPLDTLQQVRWIEPVPPRRLQPKVPRDLETICLKCLEKSPQRRYASADNLAEDLRRFLAGETIRARPVGLAEWLARWCRRKPAIAGLLAALALTVVGSLATITWLWQQAETAYRRELLAKQHLEEDFQVANRFVEAVRKWPINHTLLSSGADGRRISLLQALQTFEQHFHERRPEDVELLTRLSNTHHWTAMLYLQFGKHGEALEECRKVTDLWKNQAPGHPLRKRSLAECYLLMGATRVEMGRGDEALVDYEKALPLLQDISNGDSGEFPSNASQMAFVHHHIGTVTRAPDAAERAYRKAIELQEELATKHPTDIGCKTALTQSYNNLGGLYQRTGQWDQALCCFNKARVIHENLFDQVPQVPGVETGLAHSWSNIGSLSRAKGDQAEAVPWLEKASTLWKKQFEADPDNSQIRGWLARNAGNLGLAQHEIGQRAEALVSLETAHEHWRELDKVHRGSRGSQHDLAQSHHDLAVVQFAQGHQKGALASCREAVRIRKRLAGDAPTIMMFRQELAESCYHLGLVSGALDLPHDGAEAFRQVTEVARSLDKNDWCLRAPYRAGWVHALSAAAITHDRRLSDAERSKRVDEDLGRARELFQAATRTGHFQMAPLLDALQREANLTPLPGRRAFQQLLQKVRENSKDGVAPGREQPS